MVPDIRSVLHEAVPVRPAERTFGDILRRSRMLRTRRLVASVVAIVGVLAAAFVFAASTTGLFSSVPPASGQERDSSHFDIVEVPGEPRAIGFGYGSLWVAVPGGGDEDWALFRIDPNNQQIEATATDSAPLNTPGALKSGTGVPADLAFVDGRVWMAVWRPISPLRPSADLIEIDPRANEFERSFIGMDAKEPPELAVAGGSAWIVTGSRLSQVHLNPFDAEFAVRPRPGDDAQVVAVGDQIWVGDGNGEIAQVEQPSLSSLSLPVVTLTGAVVDLATDGTSLYASVDRLGKKFDIVQIDPRDGQTKSFDLDLRPTDLVFADGHLWALLQADGVEHEELDGTVLRIDPVEMRPLLEPIPTGAGAAKLAVGNGSVWVTKPSAEIVMRVGESPFEQ